VAQEVALGGWQADVPQLVLDPSYAWFLAWVTQLKEIAAAHPGQIWIHPDIETPDKSDGQDEGQLTSEDRSYTIVRVNFSVHPDEGLTVPYQGPYIALIDRLLRIASPKLLWAIVLRIQLHILEGCACELVFVAFIIDSILNLSQDGFEDLMFFLGKPDQNIVALKGCYPDVVDEPIKGRSIDLCPVRGQQTNLICHVECNR
jgi:hypothetical protein